MIYRILKNERGYVVYIFILFIPRFAGLILSKNYIKRSNEQFYYSYLSTGKK
jgi:hypothetical protein